ncbi:MAG: hydrogenase maturation nickel metallochaperone HypA [Armatimonadota bacterium]
MHELSITQNILDIALGNLPDNNAKITEILLKVGEFTYVDPECVKFYFEQISKDTPAEGAVIKYEKVSIKIKCKSCGKESSLSKENMVFACPECSSKDVELTSGRELFIDSIEVE